MYYRLLELDQNYKIIEYSNECATEWPKTLLNNYHEEKGNKCFIKCQSRYFYPVGNKCANENDSSKYEKSSITGNYIVNQNFNIENKINHNWIILLLFFNHSV